MRSSRILMAGAVTAALVGAALPAAGTTTAVSPSPSPSPTPTSSPRPTSTGSPRPTPAPTSGPSTPTPAPSPGTPGAGEAHGGPAVDHADDSHASAELVAASQALAAAEADFRVARGDLSAARTELARATSAAAQAQTDLTAAHLAEERAVRELLAVRASIVAHRTDLGLLARSAYQANGPFGELALVLASDTPQQLADRLAFLQSIANAGNSLVSDLREDAADLDNSRARLVAAREHQERVSALASAALADKVAQERLAQQAQQQYSLVVRARRAALAAAKEARLEDRRRYQVMVAQSGQLGTRIQELAAQLATSDRPPRGTGRMVRPGTGEVTSPFGPRYHPILHYVKVHTGIDFSLGDGLAYAADRGVVIITEFNVAYGNMTVVDHGKVGGLRLATLYAHQAAITVRPGDRVQRGQPIGVIGSTGFSTGPHLHFEVRVDGEPLDPAPFLVGAPMPSSTGVARRAASGVT